MNSSLPFSLSRLFAIGLAILLILAIVPFSSAMATFSVKQKEANQIARKDASYRSDQLIIRLKNTPTADPEQVVKKILSDKGLKSKRVKNLLKRNSKVESHIELKALADQLFAIDLDGSNALAAVRLLKSDSRVAYAEPNYHVSVLLTPDDPFFGEMWQLQNTGQTGGISDADIDAPEAWDTRHDSTVVVGIIDTGVDYTHPDLVANMWTNPGEIAGNSIDDDGNGYVDDIHGWDFVSEDNDPMDDFGHGTHVAGTVGAEGDNGIGITGVNWNAKIAAIKFLASDGAGTYEDAVEAVLYANMMGMKVTNNSWGGGEYSQALYDAIAAGNEDGNLFVAAAGNNFSNADDFPMYPAAFDLPNIISVAATDHNDGLAFFSNYGSTSVDLGAPGDGIFSTVPTTGSCILCDPLGYLLLSGTSMAAPHVSGAAALLWAHEPLLTLPELKTKLLQRTEPIESLAGLVGSEGRLSLQNLFDNDAIPPDSVNDLAVSATAHNALKLEWTATGDDGATGQASRYDVRYATSPITAISFDTALSVKGEPKPSPSGETNSMTITGLEPNTTYSVAIKVFDNIGNASTLSNVVSARTLSATNVFSDNMEHGQNGWTVNGVVFSDQNLWHLSTRRATSPTTSWYYGREDTGNYDTGRQNIGTLTSPVIPLNYITSSELVFSQFVDTENSPYYDLAQVQVRPIGSSVWEVLLQTGTTNNIFQRKSLDISAFDGMPVQIRFLFDTVDGSIQYEGWYIDDVVIRGTPLANTPPTANAGPDQVGKHGQNLTFDGSLSFDAEGPIAVYKWDFGDGTSSQKAVIKHAYKAYGFFTAMLTVTDDLGLSSTDTTTVQITDTVKITSASYKNKTLTVKATSDAKKSASLTLKGYPNAKKKKITNGYQFTVANLASKPATVTVISSLGGSDTVAVP